MCYIIIIIIMLSINIIYNTTYNYSSPLIIMCNILNVMSNNITLQLCQIVFTVGISYLAYIFVDFNCKFVNP